MPAGYFQNIKEDKVIRVKFANKVIEAFKGIILWTNSKSWSQNVTVAQVWKQDVTEEENV